MLYYNDIVLCLGSKEGGPIVAHKQQQPTTTHLDKHQEKGFLQKLKDVFWKPEETEPQVQKINAENEAQKLK